MADDDLHGYDADDIYTLATRVIASNIHRLGGSTFNQAKEVAWEAIAVALLEATEPPTELDLMIEGWKAVSKDRRAFNMLNGIGSDGRFSNSFERYWHQPPEPAPDGPVLERLALRQVMAALPDHHRHTLEARAAYDDDQEAADALGMSLWSFKSRLKRARYAFKELWFDFEPVPTQKAAVSRRLANWRSNATEVTKERKRAYAARRKEAA